MAGTETFMLNVVRTSDKKRFHYDFLVFRPTINQYRDEAERLGCIFYSLPPRYKSPVNYIKGLDYFFKTHAKEYNVIHWCGGVVSSIAPLWFAHKYKIMNIIVHSHSSSCSSFHSRLCHHLFRHLLPVCCTNFFACSTQASKFFFGSKNAVIIKNGIDLKKYEFNEDIRNLYRKELGIAAGTFVLGHVGRFEKVKNHSFLIEIFNEVLKKKENSALILIGKGPLEASIKEEVKKIGIESKVMFIGERNDVDRCMQAMDFFVMPSLYEGLPFVLVEAQAASLPCAISDTINNDAVICPSTRRITLRQNAAEWAEEILKVSEITVRKNTNDYLIENGFSIIDTVEYLECVYSQKNVL